ncbi:hypothetical protein BS78_05G078600, partial [Paspalum vaginatum]
GTFVRTVSRLLFEHTNDISGPYELTTLVSLRVSLPPEAASATAHHLLAFEEVQELKRLAAEETYFGNGTISDNLMIRAFALVYGVLLDVDCAIEWDIAFDHSMYYSPLLERIQKAMQEKRHLLLLENLHVPVPLNVFLLISKGRRPSAFQNRWLILATSKDVYDKSRQQARGGGVVHPFYEAWRLRQEHYHAPILDDLQGDWDWAVLLKEALRDATASIHHQHQQQGGHASDSWLLYYAILYHPLQGAAAGRQAWNTADEMVRCWVAEDLILSTRSPTDIPTAAAAATPKNKNYRAAYESGKVIIRALQEYSLLPPIYSVSGPTVASTTSSSASISSKDDDDDVIVVTGLSKLAEGVHRLQQDQLFDQDKTHILRWVSFMNDDGRHVSWDWANYDWRGSRVKMIPGEMNMTSLILRGCSDISRFPFSTLLNTLLRVLDLSYTPINCLPLGFSRLLSLHLLSLRGCTKLETLSAPPASPTASEQQPNELPLAHLENLQVLDMNGVPLTYTLPSDFFFEMSCLQEFILGNCLHLKELPPSLAKLYALLILHHTLKLINNILLMSLPVSLSRAKGLKKLHISNCISLSLEPLWELLSFLEDLCIQTWEALVDIRIHGHPNLRSFSLSGPWVRFLSLRGCGKLKFVNFHDDLTVLEVVDLSDTALEELLLLNVLCFKRFLWHHLVRFPKVFYLDQSVVDYDLVSKTSHQQEACADENQYEVNEPTNIARIIINDAKMFYSFNKDAAHKLVMEEQFLQCFNVQVRPCHVKSLDPKKKKGQICTIIERQFPYHDVHSSKADCIAPMVKLHPKQRHVEISANNQWPYGLTHLLSITKSMFITDDSTIRCLNELNYSMVCLQECQLIHCNEMKVVFTTNWIGTGKPAYFGHWTIKIPEEFPSLKILQISNLNNLLRLVEPSDVRYSHLITLKLLKQIHLEHCPRLEKLFPCLSLPAPETLVILFCSNLKTFFYKQGDYKVAPSPLPSIKRIYLQELPQLQHFHEDAMFRFETPNWEKLFLQGCPSFQLGSQREWRSTHANEERRFSLLV